MTSHQRWEFAAYPMVEEADATGVVAGVYADLQDRMPFVPSLFKSLALCPGYLVLAAEQATAAMTQPAYAAAAERLAGSVRCAATAPADAAATAALADFVDPLSRMLLLTAGLRTALDGDLPAEPAPGRAPQPRPLRLTSAAPSPWQAPAAELYGQIRAALHTPIVNSIWRSLAGRDLLEPAWAALRPQATATAPAATALRQQAIDTARELRWPLAATPTALRAAGLTDAAPGIASVLDAYLATLPRVLTLVACTTAPPEPNHSAEEPR